MPVILEALRAHPASRTVQMRACGALWSLAARMDARVERAEGGAIEMVCHIPSIEMVCEICKMVCQALRSHALDAEVRERACGVLWTLAPNHDNQVQMVAAGAVELLFVCVTRYAAHVGIRRLAQGALRCLAQNACFTEEIADTQDQMKLKI